MPNSRLPVLLALILALLTAPACAPTPTALPPAIEATRAPTDPAAPTAPPATTTADPTPAPVAPVTIEFYELFEDDSGELVVLGRLVNTTTANLTGIQLAFDFYDVNDTLIFTEPAWYPHLFNLPPGAATPFSYTVFNAANVATVQPSVVAYQPADLTPVELTLTGQQLRLDDFGDAHCTGQLTNPTDQPVRLSEIAAEILTATEAVIGAASDYNHLSLLRPGESTPFRITVNAHKLDETPRTCRVYVDAIAAADTTFTDVTALTAEPLARYTDALGGQHVLGQLSNPTDQPYTVLLIVGLYDASGNVLDSLAYPLPLPVLAPGLVTPLDVDFTSLISYTTGLPDQIAEARFLLDPLFTRPLPGVETVTLTLTADLFDPTNTSWAYAGQALNESGRSLDQIAAQVVVRNQFGETVAVAASREVLSLLPGDEATFNLFLWKPANANPVDYTYEITVYGYDEPN